MIKKENISLSIKECNGALKHLNNEAVILQKAISQMEQDSTSAETLAKTFKDATISHENVVRKIAGAQRLAFSDNQKIGITEDERLLQVADNVNVGIEYDGKTVKIKAPAAFMKMDIGARTRMIGRAVYAKLAQYMKDKNITAPMFEKADISIIHHISKTSDIMNIPDADNLDTKSMLDAVDGLLIPNDDLITIRLTEYGVIDEDDFTEIIVQKQDLSFL